MNKKSTVAYISFMLIMIALGASDAMRGIFSPIFQNHFAIDNTQLAMIVTISYVGNLVFLLIGGKMDDKYNKKTVSILIMTLWACSLILYLVTDNYYCLLVGMFFSMGASTLMNTMINLMTPIFFAGAPAMIINTLFFTQGIGTTGSQKIAGTYASGFGSWKIVNIILLAIGICGTLVFMTLKLPDTDQVQTKDTSNKQPDNGFMKVMKNPAFFYLVLVLGFYFVAEHGILNWLVTYCTNQLEFSMANASTYLSIFFGGVTIGRLVFAPVVQKQGIQKSITIFGGSSTVLYVIGILFGKQTIMILSIAGLSFSILYPTLIMMIQKYYQKEITATATGMIISVATLFDIGFNALFGKAVDMMGLKNSFLILPICMVCFYVCFMIFRLRVKPVETE